MGAICVLLVPKPRPSRALGRDLRTPGSFCATMGAVGAGGVWQDSRDGDSNMSRVIERVGVVGCGLMGSGIAEVAVRAGLDVVVTESSPGAAEAGMARVANSLKRALTAGRLSEADHEATWQRL